MDSYGWMMGAMVFLILFWPRIWTWLVRLDYEQAMARWQNLCPTCGYPHEEPFAERTCEQCRGELPE